MIGTIIGGHYEILKSLGEGGFGKTFLAKDIHLPDQPFRVVKLLDPQSNDPQVIAISNRLFDTEAKVLYQLGDHPQIPKLFAHFKENNNFYLVQEYIEGHDLSEEIKLGQTLSENEVIDLLRQILEVLSFIHQQNIIHRDIKPSNLIRRLSDRQIILIDFGAVKQIISQNNNITIPIHTQGYAPPEQLRGQPKLSSDLYALGVVAIQALTGLSAEQIPQDPDTLELIWQDQVKISVGLKNILEKMVYDDFKHRYPSAKEALEALQKIQSPNPSLSPTIPILSPSPSVKKTKLPLILMTVISSLILMGIIAIVAIKNNPFIPQDKATPSPTWEW